MATDATIRSPAAAWPPTSTSPPSTSVDIAGTGHPQQSHAAARAVLHEEVIPDRGDVTAHLTEIDRSRHP